MSQPRMASYIQKWMHILLIRGQQVTQALYGLKIGPESKRGKGIFYLCHGADLELGKRTCYCTKRGRGSSAVPGDYILGVWWITGGCRFSGDPTPTKVVWCYDNLIYT